jgi:small subunit ribosomal protein S16
LTGKKKKMATKIRLQRHGRKKRAFFHIVVTDSRAPRDGRFIEKLGTYNPITNPATIKIDVDKATQWIISGATPTDTANAILRYTGVNYKKHLQVGVIKGAITQEQADAKFAEWQKEKESQVEGKREKLAGEKSFKMTEALKAESKRREAVAAKVLAKSSALAAEAEAATAVETEAPAAEDVAVEEAPVTEEITNEVASTEEIITEETPEAEAETPNAEETPVVEEAPAAEEAEDAPTAE